MAYFHLLSPSAECRLLPNESDVVMLDHEPTYKGVDAMSCNARKVAPVVVACAVFGCTTFVSGCASGPVTVAPEPPAHYERLGPATGTGTGSLGIVSTAYYFIPMGLNGRVQRAYDEAVSSVPGATGLVDVTIKENWYWWLIGTARTVTVTGEAIREIK